MDKFTIKALNDSLIGSGHNADTYRVGNTTLKIYHEDCYNDRISDEVFDSLKGINNASFIKLRDKKYSKKDVIKQYYYDYIEKIDKLMIDLPMDYTYESIIKLQELLNKLNELRIYIEDANEDNVIVSNNNIVVIDPDLYKKYKGESLRLLKAHNRDFIISYITSLWASEYVFKHGSKYSKLLLKDINPLDKLFISDDSYDIDSCIEKGFDCNTPDELITKLIRKKSL